MTGRSVHKFTTPAAGCSVGFGQNTNDVGKLKAHLRAATGSYTPAFSSFPMQKESADTSNPPDIVCDLCDFSPVTTVSGTGKTCLNDGSGFMDVINTDGWYATVSAASGGIYGKFLALLNLVSTTTSYSPVSASCASDTWTMYVIFDNKVALSWGNFVNISGTTWQRDNTAPLIFPDSFSTFELTIFQASTNTFYSFPTPFKFS